MKNNRKEIFIKKEYFNLRFGLTVGVACGILFVSFASKTYSKFMSEREADESCKESTVTD